MTTHPEFDDSIKQDLDQEPINEHLLITREYTHVDSSDDDLHQLGYYWPTQMAALPLVK